MSFREQMSQSCREYSEEADRLDQKLDRLNRKMDRDLGAVQDRLSRAEHAFVGMEELVGLVLEELATAKDEVRKAREDLGSQSRSPPVPGFHELFWTWSGHAQFNTSSCPESKMPPRVPRTGQEQISGGF